MKYFFILLIVSLLVIIINTRQTCDSYGLVLTKNSSITITGGFLKNSYSVEFYFKLVTSLDQLKTYPLVTVSNSTDPHNCQEYKGWGFYIVNKKLMFVLGKDFCGDKAFNITLDSSWNYIAVTFTKKNVYIYRNEKQAKEITNASNTFEGTVPLRIGYTPEDVIPENTTSTNTTVKNETIPTTNETTPTTEATKTTTEETKTTTEETKTTTEETKTTTEETKTTEEAATTTTTTPGETTTTTKEETTTTTEEPTTTTKEETTTTTEETKTTEEATTTTTTEETKTATTTEETKTTTTEETATASTRRRNAILQQDDKQTKPVSEGIYLDELKIWDIDLPSSEIKKTSEKFQKRKNNVAYFNFNKTIADKISNVEYKVIGNFSFVVTCRLDICICNLTCVPGQDNFQCPGELWYTTINVIETGFSAALMPSWFTILIVLLFQAIRNIIE